MMILASPDPARLQPPGVHDLLLEASPFLLGENDHTPQRHFDLGVSVYREIVALRVGQGPP